MRCYRLFYVGHFFSFFFSNIRDTWEGEHEFHDVEEASNAVASRVDQYYQDQNAEIWKQLCFLLTWWSGWSLWTGVCGDWKDHYRDYEDHWDQDQEYFFKEDENLAMKRSLLSRLAECASRQVFFLMNLVDNWCWGMLCQCWALVDNWCRGIIVEHLIVHAFLPKIRPFSAII